MPLLRIHPFWYLIYHFCVRSVAHNITLLWSLQQLVPFVIATLSRNTTTNAKEEEGGGGREREDVKAASIVGSSSSLSTVLSLLLVPNCMNIINKHGMISFLIANVFTGLVTITIPTIDIHDGLAL